MNQYIRSCVHFRKLQSDVYFFQWEHTAEYLGDLSVPVGFDPSRINPRIIKNSLADRRLVLSGEKRSLYLDIRVTIIWQRKDILKGND